MTETGRSGGSVSSVADREVLESEIRTVVAKVTGVELVDAKDGHAELQIDSITRLELLAVLEQQFDIELTEDLISEFQTIPGIARVIEGASPLRRY